MLLQLQSEKKRNLFLAWNEISVDWLSLDFFGFANITGESFGDPGIVLFDWFADVAASDADVLSA